MPRTILVADDIRTNRLILRKLLADDYDILEAENGLQAIEIMKREHDILSAVLLDILMPVMDGYAVLAEMQKNPAFSQIPVIVTTGTTDGDAEMKALTLGANDFVSKPYNAEVIKRRLKNLINLRETAAIVNVLQKDELTGLWTRRVFFEKAAVMIADKPPGYYVIACMNINGFKVINDQYGTETGDAVLKKIAETLVDFFEPLGGLYCRMMADHFAVLYPAKYKGNPEIVRLRQVVSELDGLLSPISFGVGEYIITDTKLSVSAMYDRAAMAMDSIKGRVDVHVADYYESMRDSILREQVIVNEMEQALSERQYEVWLQPQYNHSTGALIGAEALVRWRHPRSGMISPGVFIPVFERNGFIYELDKYVWETACAYLRKWIDEGRTPLPISVNISRYDLFREDLVETIRALIEKYDLPASLLRLEITESAFAKSTGQIVYVIKRLAETGFTTEIDDFGSGYSSLNTLKDVPADILKLDMRFLEGASDTQRGGNILGSVVRMARWLGMSVIAEGVETVEQADYLRSIGCNYVQGFLYARPMPVDEYEKLWQNMPTEDRLSSMQTVETLDNNAFWDPSSMDTLIFNSYVGGACIFEYSDGEIEILRANPKYALAIGGGELPTDDALRISWSEHLDAPSRRAVIAALESAVSARDEVVCEATFINMPGGRKTVYTRANMRVIASAGDKHLVYCLIDDITAQHKAEELERIATSRLQTILANINGGVSAVTITDSGNVKFVFANAQYYAILGYTRRQFQEELNDAFDVVHPLDREIIRRRVNEVLSTRKSAAYEYRCIRRDKSVIYLRCNAAITHMEGVEGTVLLSVITDITDAKRAEIERDRFAARLRAIMDNINGGVSLVPVIADMSKGVPNIYANDKYFEILGYTREQFLAELPRGISDRIHPDDRPAVLALLMQSVSDGGDFATDFRAYRRDGEMIYLGCSGALRNIGDDGEPMYVSVIYDITAAKRAEILMREKDEQLEYLNDISRGLLTSDNADTAIIRVLEETLAFFGGRRACIIEMDDKRREATTTYEVCAEGVESSLDSARVTSYDDMPGWWDEYVARGYIAISDVEALEGTRATERDKLASLGMRSLFAVAIKREGEIIGLIAVDDPTRKASVIERLTAVGDYMAVILTRRELNARIEANLNNITALMHDMPGGFTRTLIKPDGATIPIFANAAFCEMFGMSFDEARAAYDGSIMERMHPADAPRQRESILRALAGQNYASEKFRILHKNGEYIWVNMTTRIVRDEKGDIYANSYYVNLSAEEKKEVNFREALPFILKAIMESSNDPEFVKDKNFTYLCCSPAFARLTGRASEAEVVGRTDFDLFEPEFARRYRQDDERLFAAGEPLVDYIEMIPSEDDLPHYSITSKYILRDTAGEVIGLYGCGRDVTAERTAVDQLTLLTESIPGGLATFEYWPGGLNMLFFNEGFYQYTGYTREEYTEMIRDNLMALVVPEDIPGLYEAILALIGGADIIDRTYRCRTKGGEIRWFNMRGKITGRYADRVIISTAQFDVTEQMHAEAEARRHDEEINAALMTLGKAVCEYDIATSTLKMPFYYANKFELPEILRDVPESIRGSGFLDDETYDKYHEFYQAIRRGEKTGAIDIMITVGARSWWERLTFVNLYNSGARAVKALIAIDEIPPPEA